jgi:hypothetical protein
MVIPRRRNFLFFIFKKDETKVNMNYWSLFLCFSSDIFISFADMKLLEFKPSVIAASALLSAAHELLPLQYPCFRSATSNCSYVNKVNILASVFFNEQLNIVKKPAIFYTFLFQIWRFLYRDALFPKFLIYIR